MERRAAYEVTPGGLVRVPAGVGRRRPEVEKSVRRKRGVPSVSEVGVRPGSVYRVKPVYVVGGDTSPYDPAGNGPIRN